jgi:hypothetical protein
VKTVFSYLGSSKALSLKIIRDGKNPGITSIRRAAPYPGFLGGTGISEKTGAEEGFLFLSSGLPEEEPEPVWASGRELRYEVLDEAGVVRVQVIDTRTGEVTLEIPSADVVRFLEFLAAKAEKERQKDGQVDVWA